MNTKRLLLWCVMLFSLGTLVAGVEDGSFIVVQGNDGPMQTAIHQNGEWYYCMSGDCQWNLYATQGELVNEGEGWQLAGESGANLDTLFSEGSVSDPDGTTLVGHRTDADQFTTFADIAAQPDNFEYVDPPLEVDGTDGEEPADGGATDSVPPPGEVPPVGSGPPTAAGAEPPGAQLPGEVSGTFQPPPGRPPDPMQAYLSTLGTVTRQGRGRYTVNGQPVRVKDNQVTFPDGSIVEVSPFADGGFTTTTRFGDTVVGFQQYGINGQPSGAPQRFDPALGVTEIGVTTAGDIVIRNQIGNVRGEYTQTGVGNVWQRTDGTGGMFFLDGMPVLTFNTDADSDIDEYVIAVGNEVYRGDSFDDGVLKDGERMLLRRTDAGIETDFTQFGDAWQPRTITRTEGGQLITYTRTYDNEGNIVSSTGRDASGRVLVMYTGEETGEPTVRYHYDERTGELDGIIDPELCPGMTCTFTEYNERRKAACDADPQSPACQHANSVVDPFRAGFWQRWDAMRRGAAAGQGYCGLLDMFSVSCGDSLFPAFDDFMQNTVIGNVLSGETSALCALWTDNPESGGSVALGPGGFASAWVAAEYVQITEPEEENGTLTGETVDQYATKITFDIRPSGIVDGECKEQMITARVILDGQLVDIDFDGFANDNDFIRLQCDKGGFSATGSRAIVRYVGAQPNEVCLLLDGDFNSFFALSLDDGKLCNRVIPLERTGIDFSCSFCIFGDSGFVEGDIMQPSDVPVLNGPPAEEETGPVEHRPEIGNPE